MNKVIEAFFVKHGKRIAELALVNGGLDVGGWGVISSGGPCGRRGLDQEEACELMHWAGVLHGMVLCGVEIDEFLAPYIEEWVGAQGRPEAEKSDGRG